MEHEQAVATSAAEAEPAAAQRRPSPRHGAERARASSRTVAQAKLAVGAADDPFEREADAIAARVVRSLRRDTVARADPDATQTAAAAQRIQRRTSGVARSALVDLDLDHDTERQIQSSRGGGAALRSEARSTMESAFDADFSGVRVHAGRRAADLNNRIQAKAFTVGQDIFFRDGVPDTSSSDGQHLLAHELTHVVQQTGQVNRVVRREGAPALRRSVELGAAPVQRTAATVTGRVAGPVVQRVGEAKAAHEALKVLVVDAQKIRDAALKKGITVEQLADEKLKLNAIATKADEHVASAKKDKTGTGYTQAINTCRAQVKACEITIGGTEVAANSSLTNIDAKLNDFRSATQTRTVASQAKVDIALGQLRATLGATKSSDAKKFAAAGREASTELASLCAAFDTDAAEALRQVAAWKVATAEHHLIADAADRSETQLRTCIQLTTSLLALLRDDGVAAADRAQRAAAALARIVAARNDVVKKDKAVQERTAAAAAATKLFELADDHARRCADEADEADKLATEAIEAAAEAEQSAQGSASAAKGATVKAEAMTSSMAFYGRHLSQAPSADASKMVDQRREEAEQAHATAKVKHEESETGAARAKQLRSESDPIEQRAKEKRSTASSASDERAVKAEDRDAERAQQTTAEEQHRSSVDVRDAEQQTGRQIGAEARTHATDMDALAVAVPDPTERARIRVDYGDATARTLINKGIRPAVLLACVPTIKLMCAAWGAGDAADVVLKVQHLAVGTDVPLPAFYASATADGPINAVRATLLLDCPGGLLPWFVTHGVRVANRLLDLTWTCPHVARVLAAAEQDAKLSDWQLGRFQGLIERTHLSVDSAEKFLKASVTAGFLTDALSSIETLLVATWTVDKIVTLVQAAGALSKPTKVQFDTFCTLIATENVVADDALKIMEGAECTGEYLVGTAFFVLRDAVADAWTTDQLKAFVKAAETNAKLDRTQIERFYLLVHDNAFTAANAEKCLSSLHVDDWTYLMNRVDNFIADGNVGVPAAVAGAGAASHTFGPPVDRVKIKLQTARMAHFAAGHMYAHYEFTSANIFRGNGNQPSSMWPVGTTAATVRANAIAAMQTAAVHDQVDRVRNGTGSAGAFDQVDHPGYTVGVQWFAPSATLMQFFPAGGAVPPHMMAAIGRLFLGAI
ncbi:MAG: hypothetical protein JWM12_1964 [Ilumatobacteraceae bacterium]|nr:hypothetical protein [Ilumatobacteraceae bacterium]